MSDAMTFFVIAAGVSMIAVLGLLINARWSKDSGRRRRKGVKRKTRW